MMQMRDGHKQTGSTTVAAVAALLSTTTGATQKNVK